MNCPILLHCYSFHTFCFVLLARCCRPHIESSWIEWENEQTKRKSRHRTSNNVVTVSINNTSACSIQLPTLLKLLTFPNKLFLHDYSPLRFDSPFAFLWRSRFAFALVVGCTLIRTRRMTERRRRRRRRRQCRFCCCCCCRHMNAKLAFCVIAYNGHKRTEPTLLATKKKVRTKAWAEWKSGKAKLKTERKNKRRDEKVN